MYETKRHMKKLGKQVKRHGLRKAVEYDWKKSHPIARKGFGLITTLGVVVATVSLVTIYAHKTYDERKENLVVEQSEIRTNNLSDIRRYYHELRKLLD